MTFTRDNIIRFRKRLFQKQVPQIFKAGTQGINPIKSCRLDQDGRQVVATQDIASFFFECSEKDNFISSGSYFSNLYVLFYILSRDAENCSFTSGELIPEKDIQKADDIQAIEYLAGNLISSYFSHLKLSNGLVNSELLDKDLKKVIKLSNADRDYKGFTNSIFKKLTANLTLEKSWKRCVDKIQKASLVFNLVGFRLPEIDKFVQENIVANARKDIEKNTQVLGKILSTKDQLIRGETNQKHFTERMNKLDIATREILKKINRYLGHVNQYTAITGISIQDFLGKTDAHLSKNAAKLFFDYHDIKRKNVSIRKQSNYLILRYRMEMLFEYPEITAFAKSLKQKNSFVDGYVNVFQVFFQELIRQLGQSVTRFKPEQTGTIENCLSDIYQAIDKLGLPWKMLRKERREIQKRYIELIKTTPIDLIAPIIDLREELSLAVQDRSKEFLSKIRKVLVDSCYSYLMRIGRTETVPKNQLQKEVQKLLFGYSLHYKPQRHFYLAFFNKYIGVPEGPVSAYLAGMLNDDKLLAVTILDIFSNENLVADYLSKDQISFAEKLLIAHQKK